MSLCSEIIENIPVETAINQEIIDVIEKCYLPKLTRNVEEKNTHYEYDLWGKNLTVLSSKLLQLINNIEIFSRDDKTTTVLAALLLLHYELLSDGPWKTEKSQEFHSKICIQFKLAHNKSLDKILQNNIDFNVQAVFDKCIELLHIKLSKDDFKMHPALIEVYYLIMRDLNKHNVKIKPTSILPVPLLLIEDYVNENKIKGLKCCSSILACLTVDHFYNGNYYEVIYGVLKKSMTEKDTNVLELAFQCLLNLFEILPIYVKISIVENCFHTILEQMYTETNLYKKKVFFTCLNNILPINGAYCGKDHLFLLVITDNLNNCCNQAVAEILLSVVLECFENWIRYCWCIWKLIPNRKLLSELVKLLYINCDDDIICERIHNILVTLFKLSSIEEQSEIRLSLEKSEQNMQNVKQCFIERLKVLKKAF